MKHVHRLPIGAAALLLFALPVGVVAQMQPPRSGPAAMRATPAPLQDGITVSAVGSATGAATTVLFTVSIYDRTNSSSITTATLQPLVDALVASGVDRNSIQLPIDLQAPGAHTSNATISGSAAHPTQAMLQKMLVEAGTVFNAQPNLYISNSRVTMRIDDCSALADASRVDAIHRARDRANGTAHDLGVKLGAILSANITSPVDYTGSCLSYYQLPGMQPPQGATMFDVRVSTPVTLRFAIK